MHACSIIMFMKQVEEFYYRHIYMYMYEKFPVSMQPYVVEVACELQN